MGFINWIRSEIKELVKPKGGWVECYDGMYILSYGKTDAIKLLNFMYYAKVKHYLKRKHRIARQFLGE